MSEPEVADVVEQAIKNLKSGYSYEHRQAVQFLGKLADNRAVEPLINVLKDKDENKYTRMCAAIALGEIGDIRAFEPLVKMFWEDDLELCEEAARALANLGEPALQPLLYLVKNGDEVLYAWVLHTLTSMHKVIVLPLFKVLQDENGKVRRVAAEALGFILDERAIEPLVKMLEDRDIEVRQAAADALFWFEHNYGDLNLNDAAKETIKAFMQQKYSK